MKKILLIEDDPEELRRFVLTFEANHRLLIATTAERAIELFDANQDADAIVIDGSLGTTGAYNTGPILTHIVAAGYKGSIIANSHVWGKQLRRDGCAFVADKGRAHIMLNEML